MWMAAVYRVYFLLQACALILCILTNCVLFRKSFPDYLLDINWLSPVDLAVVLLLRPLNIFWLIGNLLTCIDLHDLWLSEWSTNSHSWCLIGSCAGANTRDSRSDPAGHMCHWMRCYTTALPDVYWWTSIGWRHGKAEEMSHCRWYSR